MEFRRLGYFIQIAELGSLSRASERLNIAQPSLSRQVRLLEEELGVALFIRRRRGMELTEAGEALHARITGPLRQIGHAFYEVRALPAAEGGSVALGMPPTLIPILAGLLARRVADQLPGILLRFTEAPNGHLLERIRRDELDAAILYGPTPAGMNAAKLLEDELVLVGPSSVPLLPGGTIDFAQLGDLPLILPGHQSGLRFAVEAAARKAGVKLQVYQRADSPALMKELVRAGLGYSILPQHAVAREAADGDLTFTSIQDPPIIRHLFLALPKGTDSPRAVLQVEALVRREVANLIRQGRWAHARSLTVADA
jgi:LysR family transcriptional regulator, nitrogen assimilation regulatory protein